jgi:hypothetical protein
MAELRIPIIGEFKGQKAFSQAGKATGTLEKGVKKLGKTLALTFGAQQLLKFAKNAAKAFIEDEKAAVRLAQSVKNLGLAFETPRIEEFIAQLSKASGITDDQLRPAMQKLLQTTGSVAKSTELLTQALDISRGSGVDYETVVNDLSMAYVGQTKGLKKYALGLSNVELKTMSFADVQAKLTKQFSGANASYLTTYAGKLSILSTAASEATETIGKGLVDALSILAGENNTVQPLADSMAELAQGTADVIVGLADIGSGLSNLGGYGDIKFGTKGATLSDLFSFNLNMIPLIGPVLEEARRRGSTINTPGMGGYPSSALGPGYFDQNEAARKKSEADAAKRNKELAALQKKTLDTQKKSLALQKASKTLNLEAIGIEAALKGKISETDRISLLLQKAILEGNATLATQLSDQLNEAVKRNNDLKAALLATPKAPNPYADWYPPILAPLSTGQLAKSASSFGGVMPDFNVPENAYSQVGPMGGLGAGVIAGVNPTINVTVELDGQAVGGAIRDSQINDSLSGSFSQTNRFSSKGAIAL